MIPWLGGGGPRKTVSLNQILTVLCYLFTSSAVHVKLLRLGPIRALRDEAQASEIFITFLLHFHVCDQPSHTCAQTMAQLFKKYL